MKNSECDARQGPGSALTVAAIFLFLALSYLASPRIPNWIGWENGPVENLQVAILLAGGLLAVRYGRAQGPGRLRTFWYLMAPIWLVLAARELSWGACFLPPYEMLADTGPQFSSTRQLWYRPAVPFVLWALLAVLLARFVQSAQLRFLAALWKQRDLPGVEIACAMVCMLASAAAEGHLYVDLGFQVVWAAQNFEELAELGAYALVLMAQWRVSRSSTVRSGTSRAAPDPITTH